MENLPLISIITLNYNQAKVTVEFLESCERLLYPSYEVLVCDMCSPESLQEYVGDRNFKNTRFFYSDRNLGFAAGNNWGMKFARGDFFLFLNNDTEVTPDLLQRLLFVFEKFSDAGIVCPKIKYFNRPNLIQYAGFEPMNRFTGRVHTTGYKQEDNGQFDRIYVTFGAHGAAMMVKREIVEKVGGFPENFFLYYEEWDWSTRIQKAGFSIYFQGHATVYHKESVSVGKTNPMKEYYLTRNRILYMRRNNHGLHLIIFLLFFTFFTIPKTVFKYIVRKDIAFAKAFLKGVRDNFFISSYSPV